MQKPRSVLLHVAFWPPSRRPSDVAPLGRSKGSSEDTNTIGSALKVAPLALKLMESIKLLNCRTLLFFSPLLFTIFEMC